MKLYAEHVFGNPYGCYLRICKEVSLESIDALKICTGIHTDFSTDGFVNRSWATLEGMHHAMQQIMHCIHKS